MRKYEDTYQHKGLRKKLVDLLKEKGITDELVLDAINTIPRHYFLDSAFDKIAYEDRAFEIAAGQTISQPYTVAYQSQLLQIKKGDKVLEIGTGSVYQATILAEMGARVYTIERQKKLYDLQKEYYFRNKY
ncbi:MAG: protein-L-isoaspartate O-methyltransferase, partial [Chitinophagaceae bacterium]